MADVEIVNSIVGHLVTRLESLALDAASVHPKLKHDKTLIDAERSPTVTDFRRFRWTFPTRAIPEPLHVGTAALHPRHWRLALGLEVIYPFGDVRNRLTIAGVALDDSTRIIHHLEVDFTRVTVAGAYEWCGVEVEAGDLAQASDGFVLPMTITALFQRAY